MMGGGIIGILIIAVIAWFIFQYRGKGNFNNPFGNRSMEDHSDANALEILKTRYAKGEINKEEYERITKELE